MSETVSMAQIETPGRTETKTARPHFIQDRLLYAIYALTVAVSISLWFIAIRAPLWLDETVSYFLIKGGFSEIMPRQGWPNVPAYSYILWLWTKAAGTGEVALRVLSLLAMVGAVYLLYCAARELFDRDVAIIAAVIFSIHPLVIFAAIDVRPYAFGALAINASILMLVHLRRNDSAWPAALLGFLAACIVYFHLLMIVILPALAICFVTIKIGDRRALWRQGGVALAVFALAFLPVIPGLRYMFQTSGTHVFDEAPELSELGWTLAPGWLAYIFGGALLVAAATRKIDVQSRWEGWRILFCASLGLIPILILYGVSVETPIHIFVYRYRLVALPGVALCWAWLLSRIDSRALRLLFTVALVGSVAYVSFRSPASEHHGYTWKYALEIAEKNASADNAPVLICSDLPEADHRPMPVGTAVKDNALFAPLTYYKLSVPVVALPRAFNDEATQIISTFLQAPARRGQRFLALGFSPSYETLHFIESRASATHNERLLGTPDGIAVLEFTPRMAEGSGVGGTQ
jgi:hypothetical protein